MDLDLDPDLRESLSAEADERGFATTEAYVRWVLEHRHAVIQPPGERVEARLAQLAGRVESLTRTLESAGLDRPRTSSTGSEPSDWFDASREADAWADDGVAGTETPSDVSASDAGSQERDVGPGSQERDADVTSQEPDTGATDEADGFAFVGEDDVEADDEAVSEFAYSDDLEPPDGSADEPIDSEPEDGADDDEIADAIADIDIEEETDGDTDDE